MGGYVWQSYADSLPADLDKGVVFAESEATTFTQVFDVKQAGETLVGWNFKTTLRQRFDYSDYPLDKQQIWLRLWHVDFERNVYLTSDADGYASLAPTTLPGLDPGIVLENWAIEQSYFSYRLNQYNANLGLQGYDSAAPQPEMYFNISIKRLILSALVARLVAPILILVQLFVIVMVIGSNKRLEQFGVRPGAVIFTCAAFYFAVLIAQNARRDEVKWPGIVYLETVYVLTYFVILAVAANSVLLVAFPNLRLFRDNDNLWVKVFYWPTIILVMLAFTLYIFR